MLVKGLIFKFILLACISATAKLYVFSNKSRVELPDKSTLTSDFERTWYSYISNPMPDLSYGSCSNIYGLSSQLKPNNDWVVRVDRRLKGACVTYMSSNDQWYEILKSIDQQNENVTVWINHSEQVVGWSSNSIDAPYVAHREPLVWHLNQEQSLAKNLKVWADSVEWQLVWLVPDDYPVQVNASFRGKAFVEGGVIDELIAHINRKYRVKLKAHYDSSNKALQISQLRKTK